MRSDEAIGAVSLEELGLEHHVIWQEALPVEQALRIGPGAVRDRDANPGGRPRVLTRLM